MAQYNDKEIAILNQIIKTKSAKQAAIASELKISASTVTRAIEKFENDGILKGVFPFLDYQKLGYSAQSYVLVKLTNQSDQVKIIETIIKNEYITEISSVSGERFDLIIKIRGKSNDIIGDIIDLINNSGGQTETHFVLKTHKENVGQLLR